MNEFYWLDNRTFGGCYTSRKLVRVAQAKKELKFTLNTFRVAVYANILLGVVKFVSSLLDGRMIVWMLVNCLLVNSYLNDAVVKYCATTKTS